jgi:hypothetical protein
VANREFETIASLAVELLRRGAAGEAELAKFLNDDDVGVRVWAATHSLRFATPQAERVLAEAAKGKPSPTRLTAELTLREWRAGRV